MNDVNDLMSAVNNVGMVEAWSNGSMALREKNDSEGKARTSDSEQPSGCERITLVSAS